MLKARITKDEFIVLHDDDNVVYHEWLSYGLEVELHHGGFR